MLKKPTKILLLNRSKSILLSPILSGKKEYEIIEVITLKQAITVIGEDLDIDLIIESVNPNSSDLSDFLRHIKHNNKFRFIPYLVITDQPDKNIITEFIQNRANDIIIDYSNAEIILQKIEQALLNGKKGVLLVDDDKTILDYLSFVIELERFKVFTATDGEKAFDIFNNEKIDAVITDITMPGISGLELLKKIKDKDKNIPVLLITGMAGRYPKDTANNVGADGYLSKPFKNKDLVRALRQATRTA